MIERRAAALFVDSEYAAGDAGDDVAGNGLGTVGQLTPGNIRPHNLRYISGLNFIQMRNVHHNLVHGDSAKHRAVFSIQIHACPGVGKIVQVAISKTQADGGHPGGGVGDIGVVVGYAVVAGRVRSRVTRL